MLADPEAFLAAAVRCLAGEAMLHARRRVDRKTAAELSDRREVKLLVQLGVLGGEPIDLPLEHL
jgi:hypothetical protein